MGCDLRILLGRTGCKSIRTIRSPARKGGGVALSRQMVRACHSLAGLCAPPPSAGSSHWSVLIRKRTPTSGSTNTMDFRSGWLESFSLLSMCSSPVARARPAPPRSDGAMAGARACQAGGRAPVARVVLTRDWFLIWQEWAPIVRPSRRSSRRSSRRTRRERTCGWGTARVSPVLLPAPKSRHTHHCNVTAGPAAQETSGRKQPSSLTCGPRGPVLHGWHSLPKCPGTFLRAGNERGPRPTPLRVFAPKACLGGAPPESAQIRKSRKVAPPRSRSRRRGHEHRPGRRHHTNDWRRHHTDDFRPRRLRPLHRRLRGGRLYAPRRRSCHRTRSSSTASTLRALTTLHARSSSSDARSICHAAGARVSPRLGSASTATLTTALS